MRLLRLGLCAVFGAFPILCAEPGHIGVDPRVELFSILFRLAGNTEYLQGRIPAYNEAVNTYFGPWAQHDAVRIARQLHDNYGIAYDAVMSLAIHVSDVSTLTERVPFDRPGILLDSRWRASEARRFLDAARRFVSDTHFEDFLAAQKPLFDLTDARLRDLASRRMDFGWFDRFFGPRPLRMMLVPGLLTGPSSYGPRMIDADGIEEAYSIIGITLLDADGNPRFVDGHVSMAAHEFAHSYANPLIDANLARLSAAGNRLFDAVSTQMRAQAYGDGRVVLCESLVRASSARYTLEHDGPYLADVAVQYEQGQRSFLWTGEFARLLAQYESDRTSYPTLDSFMPRIAEFLDQASADPFAMPGRYEASRPQVVETSVTNGATDVPAELGRIAIRFSRPMSVAYSILPTAANRLPKVLEASFDETAIILSITVALEGERDYELSLNSSGGGSFASVDGVWLRPFVLAFRTEAAEPESRRPGGQPRSPYPRR